MEGNLCISQPYAKVMHRGYIFLANLQVHAWINAMQTGAKANNVSIIVF